MTRSKTYLEYQNLSNTTREGNNTFTIKRLYKTVMVTAPLSGHLVCTLRDQQTENYQFHWGSRWSFISSLRTDTACFKCHPGIHLFASSNLCLHFISMTSITLYLASVTQLSSEAQFNSNLEAGLRRSTSSSPSKGSLFNLCRNPLWSFISLLSLPMVKPLRTTWSFLQSPQPFVLCVSYDIYVCVFTYIYIYTYK